MNRRLLQTLVPPLVAALSLALTLPSQAASSTSSAISESIGTSVGSLSTSVEKSSRSSTKAVAQLEGDYTVTAVAALEERPGLLRLALQAKNVDAEDGDIYLYVPAATVAQARLQVGHGVTATTRPYGTEFATTEGKQAFFLVLKDDWSRELNNQAVAG
jgi:hypothetical protein